MHVYTDLVTNVTWVKCHVYDIWVNHYILYRYIIEA